MKPTRRGLLGAMPLLAVTPELAGLVLENVRLLMRPREWALEFFVNGMLLDGVDGTRERFALVFQAGRRTYYVDGERIEVGALSEQDRMIFREVERIYWLTENT